MGAAMSDDLGSFEPHLPCRCSDCALKHGDTAPAPEELELEALRDEVCRLKAELKEQQELIDRVTARIEADTAVMEEVIGERAWLEQTGNELCGLAMDIEFANAARAGLAKCAYCGAENLRQGQAMQAHMESCAKHPMAALRAERDGAIAEAAVAKRERDALRLECAELEAAVERWRSERDVFAADLRARRQS